MYCRIRFPFYLKHVIVFLTIFWFLPRDGYAQAKESGKNKFIKIANLEGLKVKCILKDTGGFMWFGTEMGLYRYDGYNTELINTTSSNIQLSSDLVLSLYEDRQANLWIGTGNGLQQLSPDRKSVKTYLTASNTAAGTRKAIHAIAEMHDGSLWCSSNDGYLYRSTDKKSFLRVPGTFFSDYKSAPRLILNITEDDNHNVWIADNQYGFQKLSLAGQILDNFLNGANKTHIACYANKSICFYANKQKVYAYTPETNEFIPTVNNELAGLLKNPARYVYQDKKGYQWLVTQNKLIRVDPKSKQTDDFTREFMNSGANIFQIDCIYEDVNDELWFGSYFGVYKLNNQNNIFRIISLPAGMSTNAYFSTRGIVESAHGNLFIGSYSGFFKYNKALNQFTEYKIKRDTNWVNPMARAIVKDTNNNLWLATEGNGLLHFDIRSHTFTGYLDKATTPAETNAPAIPSVQNNSLLKDTEGQLWLGGYDNLYKLNLKNGKAQLFRWGEEKKSLSALKIMAILQSRNGSIWVGTDNGLYCIKKEKGVVSHYYASSAKGAVQSGLTENFINCIYEDNNGRLWLGTKGGGVNVLNP
ncbi:MAG: two-component regulator propeller domain-containing protein [Segetibacter sp.]